MPWVVELPVLVVMVLHLVACPYTKVEESFSVQAMHDILYHRTDLGQYDHLEFPGVVPRSFLGPLLVSSISAPFVWVTGLLGISKLFSQYVVRACLGIYVLMGFQSFCVAIKSNFGPSVKRWLILVTLSQFHFMFYTTRPLPNVFALGLVLQALSYWLHQRYDRFLWTSGIAVLVLRSELALYLGLILFIELVSQRLSVLSLLRHAIPAGMVILACTVLVDSLLWRRWLWPEGKVLWYNIVLNKSSYWGTSPFMWYFYSAIPRALAFSTFLIPVGIYFDRRLMMVTSPALAFIFLYSFLPHKELRFIIYTFPVLNVAVACALSRLWLNRSKSILQWFIAVGAVSHLVGNVVTTGGFLYISHSNYPGGNAMATLHRLLPNTDNVTVHIDLFTAQTGVTRFTQLKNTWRYNKTEELPPGGKDMNQFSHLLVGGVERNSPSLQIYSKTHKILAVEDGFERLKFDIYATPPYVEIITAPKIFLLERKKNV